MKPCVLTDGLENNSKYLLEIFVDLDFSLISAFVNIVKSYMIYWTPHSCDQYYASLRPLSATSQVKSSFVTFSFSAYPNISKGAQWLSGRVFDSRPRGHGFEPQRRH